MNKPKLISITALKGGTGKSVITFNIISLLSQKYNKKVLVVDSDPQHNMSNLLFKVPKRSKRGISSRRGGANKQTYYTTEDIYENSLEAETLINNTHIKNLDIISTTISLTAIELQISSVAGRELILKNWISDNEKYLEKYDYIFFDCNPTMSIINVNTYICCDSIVLISDIDIDGIEAVATFLELYYPIQYRIDRKLEDNIKGLLINKVLETTKLTKDFMEYIKDDGFEFQDILLDNHIHNSVALAETKLNKEPIGKDRNKRSYEEINNVIKEMIERGIL